MYLISGVEPVFRDKMSSIVCAQGYSLGLAETVPRFHLTVRRDPVPMGMKAVVGPMQHGLLC